MILSGVPRAYRKTLKGPGDFKTLTLASVHGCWLGPGLQLTEILIPRWLPLEVPTQYGYKLRIRLLRLGSVFLALML